MPTAPSTPTIPSSPRPSAQLTVSRGDSLWVIAAHRLRPGANDVEIAHEWPRWYNANRDVIGTDPNLLTPGAVLVAPLTEA